MTNTTKNSNTENNSSAIFDALNSVSYAIWENIFAGSLKCLGVSGLTAIFLFSKGFNSIIGNTISIGYFLSQTYFYKQQKNDNEKLISNTKRVFTFESLYFLLNINENWIFLINSLLTFNLLTNPLLQSTIAIIGIGFSLDIFDILWNSLDFRLACTTFLEVFDPSDDNKKNGAINKIIISLVIGNITSWIFLHGLMNPYYQPDFFDGILQTTLISILSYFHGSFIYEVSSNLIKYFNKNLNIFHIRNQQGDINFKIKPNKDTVLGDFCDCVQSVTCTMYDVTKEIGQYTSDLSSFFKKKDKESNNVGSNQETATQLHTRPA